MSITKTKVFRSGNADLVSLFCLFAIYLRRSGNKTSGDVAIEGKNAGEEWYKSRSTSSASIKNVIESYK